jgi:rod shape-determining protein MreC
MPLLGGAVSSLVLLLISLGLMIFSGVQPAALGGLRSGAADMFAPALTFVSQPFQDAAAFVRDVSGIATLQADNQILREENIRLREWYQAAQLLEAENKSLRDLLNVKIEPQNKYITTRVIGDGGNAFVKSMLLAGGTHDGVRKNQAVLAGEGLVGRIIEAGSQSSRILLITDINSRVPVLVEDSRQHAIMAGTNGEMPMLMHLPPDSAIAIGARIITSGHGGIFPPGLPVGKVELDAGGTPYVKLYADMNRLVHVRVVDRPEDPNLRPSTHSGPPAGF